MREAGITLSASYSFFDFWIDVIRPNVVKERGATAVDGTSGRDNIEARHCYCE